MSLATRVATSGSVISEASVWRLLKPGLVEFVLSMTVVAWYTRAGAPVDDLAGVTEAVAHPTTVATSVVAATTHQRRRTALRYSRGSTDCSSRGPRSARARRRRSGWPRRAWRRCEPCGAPRSSG